MAIAIMGGRGNFASHGSLLKKDKEDAVPYWRAEERSRAYYMTEEYKQTKIAEGLAQQRQLVDQLRQEAALPRVRVSECVEELKKYCEQHEEEDSLIKGFDKQKDNPFKEKGGCVIL